jgi:hypothetical protein
MKIISSKNSLKTMSKHTPPHISFDFSLCSKNSVNNHGITSQNFRRKPEDEGQSCPQNAVLN